MVKKTLSQNIWLQRDKSDRFKKYAKKEGYRSRAAYKLLEIENKFKILKPNLSIIDLGAAPGSWSQVVATHNKIKNNNEKIFAVDINDIVPVKGVIFIKKNVNDLLEKNSFFVDRHFNLILSDMAPRSTGHKFTDQANASILAEKALVFAKRYLYRNGNLVCKLLGGNNDKALISDAKKYFKIVKLFKPTASRNSSKEIYLICLTFNNLQ